MKKTFVLFLVLISIVFVGCSNKTKTEEPKKSTEPEKTVQVEKYTIEYDLDGGECSELPKEFEENKFFNLPTPTKEGYDFLGWYEGDKKVEALTNKNYSLKAKWELQVLEVKIYNGDKLLDKLSVNYGETLDDSIFNKYIERGIKFVSCTEELGEIKENKELHCVFEEISNAIVFIYKEDKIECKIFKTTYIGILIEFNVSDACGISSKLTKASTIYKDNVCKFIYSADNNITSDQELFSLNKIVDISDVKIEAYLYNESKELEEITISSYIVK